MMKRLILPAGLAVIAGLLILMWSWRLWTGPGPVPAGGVDDDPSPAALLVRVTPGMTLTAAADTLVARRLLAHRRVLLLGARLTGRDRSLRAGLYELAYGASPRGLLETLTSGVAVQVKVTIPEGLDAGEIAELVGTALGFPPGGFLAAADSLVEAEARQGGLLGKGDMTVAGFDSLLAAESARHSRQFRWCEGHLAPDTYLFAEGTDGAAAARFLVAAQWTRLDSVLARATAPGVVNLSRQELLTLASIVEAEARIPAERSRIAAVYVNRLVKGRRLEADPTVAFILEKKGKRLFYRDLEVESPYNTYRNRGLPPGPIGGPGLASLEAAARPDTSCHAMFFVSDGRGGHVFSDTAREHEAAVREFRRIRAQGKNRQDD